MLSREVSRREASVDTSEKSADDRAKEEVDRREKGRAMLLYVSLLHMILQFPAGTDRRLSQRQQLLSQLIMDSCDVWIPATNVGYANLNDGVLGALG